jgi:hypothetical protein
LQISQLIIPSLSKQNIFPIFGPGKQFLALTVKTEFIFKANCYKKNVYYVVLLTHFKHNFRFDIVQVGQVIKNKTEFCMSEAGLPAGT